MTRSKTRTSARLRGSTASGGQGAAHGSASAAPGVEAPLSRLRPPLSTRERGGAGGGGAGAGQQPLAQPPQEMVGQDDQRHVAIPPTPAAQFRVVHPHLPFALPESTLHRPPHAASAADL